MIDQSETQPVTGSADVEALAAEWLERKNFSTWSETDRAALDTWLADSWAHRVAYWRIETAWSRAERLTALRSPVAAQPAKPNRVPPALLKVAGVLLVAGAIGISATGYFSKPSDARYATAIGERKVLKLADGSQVELNTATELRISKGTNNRTVWLDKGEAYFDIRHDAARPFTVIVGNRRITDLGTKFSVRNDRNQIKVALVEGRARVDPLDTSAHLSSAILSPGDVAIATVAGLSIVKTPERELRNALGWRNGMLIFVHATLADVAAEFNRYNTTKIVIDDPVAARRRIGATFPAQDLEDFAALAQTVLRLHVEKKGSEIVISR